MANEFDMSFSINYDSKIGPEFTVALANILRTQSDKRHVHHLMSVATAEEAIPLGELTAPFGLFVAVNWDETNYVEVRLPGTGAGNDTNKIPPLCFLITWMGSDVSAPYIIANTAACKVEYWLWMP